MTAPRHHRSSRSRHGAPLLTGLAVGAVLIGAAAFATPEGSTDPAVQAALGAPLTPQLIVPSPAPVARPTPARPSLTVPAPVPAATPAAATPAPSAPGPSASPTPEPVRATPEPTPTPAPEPVSDDAADAVLAATNAERTDAGCDDLRSDPRLDEAAQGHAQDMSDNDYFSHTSQDGREFDERIRDAGHPNPGGENIAAGQETAQEVVAAWMASEGHRRNILDCSFTALGVGHAPGGNYWVQNFGR